MRKETRNQTAAKMTIAKKVTAWILMMLLTLALAACGTESDEESKSGSGSSETQQETTDGSDDDEGSSADVDGDEDSTDASDAETADAGTDGGELAASYVITDEFALDFSDMTYDSIRVFSGDGSCDALSAYGEYGYPIVTGYTIILLDGDEGVADYEVYVLESEESATGLKELLENEAMVQEGNVLYYMIDATALQETIDLYASVGMISETTVSAYLDFLMPMNGYEEVTE